jgi:hypothetical protein
MISTRLFLLGPKEQRPAGTENTLPGVRREGEPGGSAIAIAASFTPALHHPCTTAQ